MIIYLGISGLRLELYEIALGLVVTITISRQNLKII